MAGLADLPFYGTFLERTQMNQQQPLRQAQQAGALVGLQQALQQQAQEQQLMDALRASGGDVEQALKASISGGNLAGAAKLASIVEAQRKSTVGQPIGAGGLRLPDGTVIPPVAKPEAEPEIVRLQKYLGMLPEGDPRRAPIEARITSMGEKGGMTINMPGSSDTVTDGKGNFFKLQIGKDGETRLVPMQTSGGAPLKPAASEKPPTEFQGKNSLYGSRAAMADQTLLGLEENISLVGLATKEALQNTPVIGGALGAAANLALSADQQKVEQAQRNFVNAVLRQESGAVISQQEFDNAKKQYFPQPGDTKEVIEQKRANRKTAIDGFKRLAGPAWAETDDQVKAATTPSAAPTSPKRLKFDAQGNPVQ